MAVGHSFAEPSPLHFLPIFNLSPLPGEGLQTGREAFILKGFSFPPELGKFFSRPTGFYLGDLLIDVLEHFRGSLDKVFLLFFFLFLNPLLPLLLVAPLLFLASLRLLPGFFDQYVDKRQWRLGLLFSGPRQFGNRSVFLRAHIIEPDFRGFDRVLPHFFTGLKEPPPSKGHYLCTLLQLLLFLPGRKLDCRPVFARHRQSHFINCFVIGVEVDLAPHIETSLPEVDLHESYWELVALMIYLFAFLT